MFRAKTDRKSFFLGEGYPLLSFALIIFGYFTGLELYTIVLNILLVCIAILWTGSLKPFLFFVMSFMYQLNPEHMPVKPFRSDYYYTGHRVYLLATAIIILVVSVIVFVFKYRIWEGVKWSKIPLLIPLIIFSVTMLTNGAIYDGKDLPDLLWGAAQACVYLILFVLLYLGLQKEDGNELSGYFSYLTILNSWILILEIADLYIFGNAVVDGVIIRDNVTLGFGICTIVGAHIAMHIPMNLYGFMKGKHPYISMITAFVVYIAALASTSRNAMLFGTVYFVMFLMIIIFSSGKKRDVLIALGVLAAFALIFVIIFREQLILIVELYLNRGMGDNGRYPLWRLSYEAFLSEPIFGKGFYSVDLYIPGWVVDDSFSIVPGSAHNTVLQLLATTGIVGLIGYSVYRIATFVVTFRRASSERLLLMLGASFIVVASLLDNYIFQLYGTLYYTIAVVISSMLYSEEMRIWNDDSLAVAHIKTLRCNIK